MIKLPINYLLIPVAGLCLAGSPQKKEYVCPTEKPDQRPNIIFILTDDQRWDALGYAGNTIIQTPEMDKLAAQGCYFKNSFITTPISAASRASIMTGMYERKHGFTFGQPPMSKSQIEQSYFALLKEAGYYNGFLGKFGVIFEDKLDTTLFDIYQPEGTDFYWRLANRGREHIHLTDLMGQRAVSFIENAPKNTPFCLSISYNAPHAEDRSPEQYIWPEAMDTFYCNTIIPNPELSDDKYFEQQPDYVKDGLNRARWYWRYDNQEKYQQMVKGYYRMISGIDRTIGWIRESLDKQGIADNTIIILMGDNGYFMGERQFAGKWLMYENALRVPLIIYDPRQKQHHDIEDMALNIDIAPTILDFAMLSVPKQMQGLSLMDYVKGKRPAKERKFFLCEHLWDIKAIPPSEGIRTDEWKYFRYRHDPKHEELYHLSEDPLEKNNLAADPRQTKQLEKLRKQCNELIANSQ